MGRPKKYTNKKIVQLEMDEKLKNFLVQAAKAEGKSLRDLIVGEILLNLESHYIVCPQCGFPVLDRRKILYGSMWLKCNNPQCNHEFEYKDDPDEDYTEK